MCPFLAAPPGFPLFDLPLLDLPLFHLPLLAFAPLAVSYSALRL
jgi:hypothetical protein